MDTAADIFMSELRLSGSLQLDCGVPILPNWLLIDTCVWLDLAKDHRELPVVNALAALIESEEIRLIVPEVVLTEFRRNRERVAEEARTSFKTHVRLARDAVKRYGPDASKDETLAALHDVDHEIHTRGDGVTGTMEQIERLLSGAVCIPASDAVKTAAFDRALASKAPFHRAKNSAGDALILETYIEHMAAHVGTDERFTFITHNIKDFSEPSGDTRRPHPDLAPLFDDTRSVYATTLEAVLREIDEELLDDADFELNYTQEPRRLTEILDAENLLFRQVWYNRHWNLRSGVESGKVKVIPDEKYVFKKHSKHVKAEIWRGALAAAKRTEDEVGLDNLGPWDDFEWGMLNGKLSALRWILGDDWDMLDT